MLQLPDSTRFGRSTKPSTRLTLPSFEPGRDRKIGLDTENLPAVRWGAPPIWKHVVCIGWGPEDAINYVEVEDMRPGRFRWEDLQAVRESFLPPEVVVVGHNVARSDLDLLNGLLIAHGLPMLPALRYQDTMNNLKTGYAYRNSLRQQCKQYSIQLKKGGPDWDRVMQGYPDEYQVMEEYNRNDVLCTLQLERALDAAGLPCPIRVWEPRKKG